MDVELTADLLHIHYNPEKITPGQMVKTVGGQGFESEIKTKVGPGKKGTSDGR